MEGKLSPCDKCGKDAKFYRVKARRSYACEWCGAQVYPTAGTPFDRTRTSLRDWFFVMFLFTSTRNGVAAKEVERQIGVTYKTAWRMCHEIRKYMAIVDVNEPLGGFTKQVEVDETFVGGRVDARDGTPMSNKTVVMGLKQRGGDVMTMVVPDRKMGTLLPIIKKNEKLHSTVHTDDWIAYGTVGANGFYHKHVNHLAGEYVSKSGATVNEIENFWSQLKRSINGTHIHVSRQHLSKYLGEFEFRHNRRAFPHLMLDELMTGFVR